MKEAGVREVKAHLSQYLREVKKGDEIIITERGNVIAHIVSASPNGGENRLYEDLSLMAKRGLVRLPVRWGKPTGRPRREAMKGSPLSDAVIEDRR